MNPLHRLGHVVDEVAGPLKLLCRARVPLSKYQLDPLLGTWVNPVGLVGLVGGVGFVGFVGFVVEWWGPWGR